MSPSQHAQQPGSEPALRGDAVVISGMSGLFPASHSVHDLSQILYSKTNPVDNDNLRWTLKHPQASEYTGKVPGLDRFDAQFFMVHARLGERMDPMARKVLEQAYQAIYDAGCNPKHFDGKKVGVYMASAFSETESHFLYQCESKSIYNLTGMSRTMYANRISYWLNAKGPSLMFDDACCGSVVALEEAYHAMNSGAIEAAVVAGVNICLAPHTQVHSSRCFKTSPDDKTKSFDQEAAGCVKSEAISVLFLQKAKDAVRAYAEVVSVKNAFISSHRKDFDYKNFGFIRDPVATSKFLKTFYSEACVLPNDVEFIEACGTATPEADKAELQSIEKVFCNNRSDPLLVGSVMSNIGYTDAASGVTAITKVLLGYHYGVIASNLHCVTPRQDIPAIQDGRLCVLTDHRPFRGTYAAVNCLSYAGVNSHVLLRGCSKPKDLTKYKSTIPRLVTVSARQEEHLNDLFSDLKSRPIDAEELALLQNIHSNNVTGHLGRGYIILDTDEKQNTVSLMESMEHFDGARRPLWFVYSGMGSQWAGMGAQLIRIPVFAAAIERKVLEPRGIDLVHIITSPDKTIFDNVLHAFVGIAAMQIGITDILTALKLYPDYIIGHSVGELGCAYADGCLTAEEMILSAASRGEASNDVDVIRGAMAAIGLGYEELSKICPTTIDIACHNSATSSTISGPEVDVRDFVTILTARGVFAKEVACANIAYHSRYIKNAGPYLMNLMADVIKEPRPRSERWLSTSVPQERWNEPSAKRCSAAYLTHNLLNPVLFEETSRLIPRDAVLVEIAPHGLLQAILKRALPDSCRNIPLTLRGHADNAQFLLNAVGKLYIEGFHPQVQFLYPKVEFPVSTGTPHLGHLVKWNHSDRWTVSSMGDVKIKSTACCNVIINIHDENQRYLSGNIVQGKNLYPFAGALVAVWDTLAMILGFPEKKLSVVFRDVHLYTQPIIHDQKQLNLDVSIHRGSGYFEVIEEDSKITTGYINVLPNGDTAYAEETEKKCLVDSSEVYEQLNSRGYFYKESFRSIAGVDESVTSAQIVWNDNWVTLIDGLFQLNALKCSHEEVSQLSQIRELCINVDQHAEAVTKTKTLLNTVLIDTLESTRCGGISLSNLKFHNLPLINQSIFKLSTPTSDVNDPDLVEQEVISKEEKFVLSISNVGELDTLHWEQAPVAPEDTIQVLVHYAGLNILDSKRATGVIPFDDSYKYFGMDFSGVTKSGSRVMGVVQNGAASTVLAARPDLLWPVPPSWTLEDAATVPLAYAQAFYYLCMKSNLQHGWKVLIHGGAGALGQAAISIALAHGCKVFTTVSDADKKAFLLQLFPELNEKHIGNSRDDSFGDMVLNATKGNGCEIVMSCVHNDLKNISLKCAAFSGITYDMHQIKDRDEFEYGMFNMTKQRAYIAADFCSVLESQETTELKTLQSLVCEGISKGYVRPLTRVSFAADDAARAFRLLAASRHRGRALLQLRDSPAPAIPKITCSPCKAQLIVCDGTMFGFQLADRLIARGARKLFIYCLNPSLRLSLKLRSWTQIGVKAEIFPNQVAESDILFKSMKEIITRENIEGVYVSVTNIDNKQNDKVDKIIKKLDILVRKIDLPLKHFAVICGSGSMTGKNTVMSRSTNGLPATILSLPDRNKEQTICSDLIEESIWNRYALNVTEIALRSKHPVLYVQKQDETKQNEEKRSLLKMISSLTGNELLFENSRKETTLGDLGLHEYLPTIQFFLKTVHHVSFDDEYVMKLTKTRIMEIESRLIDRQFEDIKGLHAFFFVEQINEVETTSDWMPMNTLAYDVEMMEGAIDASRAHLFVVPGLEGLHMRFRTLCMRLKLPALVLQPGLDRPRETPQLLARRYAKTLLEEFKLKTDFYLLGYEFGIIVALELAAILEDHDLIGTIYCVGDGPDEMRALLESELCSFDSETSLQEGICHQIHSLMTKESPTVLESALRDCSSWQERVDTCVRSLLGRVPQTAQYLRSLLEAVYARIGVARSTDTTTAPRALRSRLVLLRARSELSRAHGACSLQRYSRREFHVIQLAAPMPHATTDLRVPAIVNKYFLQDLHQNKITNMCNTITS